MDPIHQFEIIKYFPLFRIGSAEIHFTNSALFMFIAVGMTALLMLWATNGRQLIPDRLQSTAEICYEFVATTLRNSAGEEGMKFFPFVFSLFTFVLFANVLGLIPFAFAVTSHIIITAALALMVFATVLIYGIWRNGVHFLRLFVPSGIPIQRSSAQPIRAPTATAATNSLERRSPRANPEPSAIGEAPEEVSDGWLARSRSSRSPRRRSLAVRAAFADDWSPGPPALPASSAMP